MTVTTIPRTLTKADRCDKCGAEAQLLAILPSGFELLFCGHHAVDHVSALDKQGAKFWNKREES